MHEVASRPSVISIVWAGGVGKTTLAKVRIVKAILETVRESSTILNEFEVLLNYLRDFISGRRILLVLDDVWTKENHEWEQLRNSLTSGGPGSKVLVTTRSDEVAIMMGATETHRLGQLSDEDCWLLMNDVAFYGRSEEDCQELEDIGRKIADKCKGLPLAAKVLGNLYVFKTLEKSGITSWRAKYRN
ncbi:putative disease resistance protein [Sesamum alatum]|uniref:Disease resistance protein n=1 Tax=Sesamum alatum TaxID=300844 RepID=A0AAE1YBR3_9LAMI|nr:putative disease resistance protein [Sesamum alatum]